MKLRSSIIIISLLLTACRNKGPQNKSHLPPKVMKQLLMDIHIAESYSTFKKDTTTRGGTKNIDSLGGYYKTILAHYKMTPEQFSDNVEWYKDHPDDLDTLYSEMIPVAAALQTQVTQAIIKPAVALPSLK